jgi:two-component system sensor histidine kinase MtrB
VAVGQSTSGDTPGTDLPGVVVDVRVGDGQNRRPGKLGLRPRRLRLRARLTLAFGLGALLMSTLLSAITYGLTRDNLLDRREQDAVEITRRNARRVENLLIDEITEEGVVQLLEGQGTIADATPVIRLNGFGDQEDVLDTTDLWFSADPQEFGPPLDVEPALLESLSGAEPGSGAQMRYRLSGTVRSGQRPAFLVIGIVLEARNGIYMEAVPLSDIEDALGSLGLALLGAGALSTLSGVALGSWASRRVLSPLEEVSHAAEALAAGDLSARLDVAEDRDLSALADSFNDMAANLEERIERDARFASDVSHELRSPLMTIMASAEVINSRRNELPERALTALDLLMLDLERFRRLVEDLLEIARYDTSQGGIAHDHFGISEFVRRVAQDFGYADVPVIIPEGVEETVVAADKRRLARVIANLLENAENYAGGATSIEVRQIYQTIEIAVEDAGPGVPVEERQLIFGRFARGSEGGRRGAGTGTGLGLALVAEHVRLHGGRARVDDRPDGKPGVRFVVALPVVAT